MNQIGDDNLKKLVFALLFCLLLTGCFGETGSGIITKTCTKTIEEEGLTITKERVIKNENNNIIVVIFRDTITNNGDDNYFKALKNSYTSEVNSLNESNVLSTIDNEKDEELIVTYNFNYSNLDDKLKEKYNLTDLNHNQVKKYEEEGFKCK